MANMADPIEITREPFKPGQAKPGATVEEAAPTVILDETAGADAASTEDMLASAKKAAEEKDRELEQERQRTRDAENRARRATEEAGKQAVGRIAEQQRGAKAELDAATAAKRSAMDALRAARDAGDLDAEAKAIDDLTDANVRAREAQGHVTRIDALIKQGAERQGGDRQAHQDADGGESPAFRAWKKAHPKFESDKIYRGVAVGAHEQALEDGIIEGSPAYWRFVNKTIADHYGGDEQGGSGGGRGNDMGDQRGNGDDGQNGATRERAAAFSGAPPARSGEGNSPQGYRQVKTMLGTVHVRKGPNGAMQIQIPPGLREDWQSGADIAGMTLAAYAQEQVLAAQERAGGGNGGLIEGNEMQIR